ncbi:MAG: class I SAM-dependent methyltransferase [Myxococcota bacterium]
MPLSVIGADLAQDFYARLAGKDAAVLILGAGEGELACALARRGHDVVAVEPSSRLLTAAIERREADAPKASLRLVNADPRTERLGRRFAVVLLPRNALGLAHDEDEARALLSTVAAHLAPDGAFALDAQLEPPPPPGDAPPPPRVTPHLRERRDGQLALHRLELFRLTAERLDELLREVGLEARERYQDFRGTPPDHGAALQVVVGGPSSGTPPD